MATNNKFYDWHGFLPKSTPTLGDLENSSRQLLKDNQKLQWERVDDNHIILELGCKKAVVHTEKEALRWLNKTIKKYIKDNHIFKEAKNEG